jgi:hypothetical protein
VVLPDIMSSVVGCCGSKSVWFVWRFAIVSMALCCVEPNKLARGLCTAFNRIL